MPELPEVQTIIDDLNKKIKGEKIVGFWSDWGKAIKNMSLADFKKNVVGKKIVRARRIGKNMFIDLSGGKTLYIHLKMTGHLLVKSEKLKVRSGEKDYFSDRVNKYIHHIWMLGDKKDGKKTLEFSDLRKFGKIVLADTNKISELPEIKKLGVDAMDKSFTLKVFEEIISRKKNSPIGIILMEQSLIAGIGNIYRSEILFESGVDPRRKASDLSGDEINKIFKEIKKVLKKAIKMRGTSDSDYRDTSGAPGRFHKVLKVYRRGGKECKKCANIIKRGKIGQRSFFYCPTCQK